MEVDFSLISPLQVRKLEAHRIIHSTRIDLSTSCVSAFTEATQNAWSVSVRVCIQKTMLEDMH